MTAQGHGSDPAPGLTPGHELGFDLPAPATISKKRIAGVVLGLLVVLGAAFLSAYLPRQGQRAALAESVQSAGRSAMRVEVIAPKAVSSDRAVLLPGSVQPLEETVLYARASGFVRRWRVDIGDKVKQAEVLVELDTPELDQELDQARAQLAQAQSTLQQALANRELSKSNLRRYEQLAKQELVAEADLDQHKAQAQVDEANAGVARATIAAQEANIRRLSQLKSFSLVTAPFAGMVTQRWVELGALVTAGNGQPLYKIAAIDPARVFVQVPQDVAPGVRADVPAKVSVREYAGRTFEGRVSRSSGELDSATRTMNTEIRVPNADGALMPGMYAQVALTLPSPHRVLELPGTALMNRAEGLRVAVVDAESRIHLVPVVVERDTGANVEISTGLTGGERVVKFGSAEFVEGKPVDVIGPAR
ncbi:MAG TPA: efflux RND transporter periplasmic adaptor subunit [Polyangiaceae bacterium]|jgi:RND family efflux transporter MFP subunit|nr:efflux RND transporter periplasmic adaptor subunit [Polyangiaceae bacterium]